MEMVMARHARLTLLEKSEKSKRSALLALRHPHL
jgi:hypothetical protein